MEDLLLDPSFCPSALKFVESNIYTVYDSVVSRNELNEICWFNWILYELGLDLGVLKKAV